MNNIFSEHEKDNNLSEKLTYTLFKEMIPKNALSKPIKNWKSKYVIEWRWRLLRHKNKRSVEISYLCTKNKSRIYKNKYGEYVLGNLPDNIYKNIIEEYYYYI